MNRSVLKNCRFNIAAFIVFCLFFCAGTHTKLHAQPSNDNFAKAEEIKIAVNGYGKGTFTSSKINLTKATKEAGESFHLLQYFAGTDKKSVWFYFETQLRRNVTIELKQQDTLIAQDAVGFTVYKTGSQQKPPNLGEVEGTMTPVSKFGSTANTCLAPSKYYIQVSAKASANAEIWINIKVDNADPAPYDLPKNAYSFGKISGSKTIGYDIGCQAIDSINEIYPALGKDYNQTTWATFTTDNYSDLLSFTFWVNNKLAGPDTVIMGYKLYKGDATKGISMLQPEDSAIYERACHPLYPNSCGLIGRKNFYCPLMPNTTYSVQLFFHKNAQYQFSFGLDEMGEELSRSANPQALPAAYQLGALVHNKTVSVVDRFACNSRLKDNLCGTVNPAFVTDTAYISNNIPKIDTFDLNLWLTFEVKESGIIAFESRIKMCNNNNDYNRFLFRVFKGDVTQSCNLPLVAESSASGWGKVFYNNLCLEPGVYSFQALGAAVRVPNNTSCQQLDLGKIYNMQLTFTKDATQTDAIYYLPSNPEDLGDITSELAAGLKTKQDYLGSPDDSIKIEKTTYRGRFIYRQFYIDTATYLELYEDRTGSYYSVNQNVILSGKISEGADSVKHLPDSLYGRTSFTHSKNPYLSTCTPLPAGWYTVMSFLDINCSNRHMPFANFIHIRSFKICQKKFNRPYKAHVANAGVPLDYNNTPNSNGETFRSYTFTEDCFGCILDTPFSAHPVPVCERQSKYQAPYNRSSYYVFSLKRASQVSINVETTQPVNIKSSTEFQLYKGDVRQDSLKFTDSVQQLLSCSIYGEFCMLAPGTYTIVVFGERNEYLKPVVKIERPGTSAFDFAANAADLGFIANGMAEKFSPNDYIFCSTGAYNTDPDTNSNYFGGMKTSVPYPMEENYKTAGRGINIHRRRNLWYTFTCKGTGKVTVTTHPKFEGSGARYSTVIYRSDEKGNLSFSQLKAMGKIDSTNKQGLTFIANYYTNNDPAFYNTNTISFEKLGCDSVRYYIIVDKGNLKQTVNMLQISVKYLEHGVYGEKGDHCANAEEITMSAPGTKTGTTLINCHTKGEGFGEDGSNLGCLVRDGMKYKTSWFKLKYTGSQRVDLSFSIKENSTAHPTQIRYRVLYGNCNAMTPGPCVEDAYSSFKLDCMGAGDYYVQVVSPAEATGTISIEAIATPTTYPICKPADLLKPLSNFSYTGGCNNEPVQFINLGSAGAAISYEWDLGNGAKSTDKDPLVQYIPIKAVDTFWVTLIVRNGGLDKYDSLTIPVIVFKDPVKAKVKQKNIFISCHEKIKLEAESNYPFSTFEWSPKEGLNNAHISNPEVIPGKEMYYVVTVRAENCIIYDTVFIHLTQKKIITGDTVICGGSAATLKAPNGYQQYRWTYIPTGLHTYGQAISITKPGKYGLQAITSGQCYAWDTINIELKQSSKLNLGKDTFLCNGQKISLKPDITGKAYFWSTGAKTASILVDKPGTYWLRVHLHDSICDAIDTIIIKPGSGIQLSLGKDTALCPGASITLTPNKTGTNYLWSTGETTASITVNKPGKYWLLMNMDFCEGTDTINIAEHKIPALEIPDEIYICGKQPAVLSLDNKPSLNYYWSTGTTGSKAHFTSAGKYFVTVMENGCSHTDTFEVKQAIAPVINLGKDTALCGDFNLILDAGEGVKYFWQPGGSSERFFPVNNTFGRYIVKVFTEKGCETSDTIHIKESCEPLLWVPTAFTPGNNDFMNQVFKAVGQHINYFDMRIYNRWGERIFQSNNIEYGWDGTYKNKPCQMDVYLWTVEYRGKGVTKYLSGTVTLLR